MSGQRYQQHCALARAVEVVGNRWTLLIIRELRPGPRRFTDLLDGLPGVSRKLLTERLRDLERDGVIARRELPPPAARTVYELTGDGRDLATAMAPLIAWGARRLGARRDGDVFRPRWLAVAMVGLADRRAAAGVTETYQLVIGEDSFHFVIDDGAVDVHDGVVENASLFISADDATWADIATGTTRMADAVAAGAVTVTGDKQAQRRFAAIFPRDRMLAGATLGDV